MKTTINMIKTYLTKLYRSETRIPGFLAITEDNKTMNFIIYPATDATNRDNTGFHDNKIIKGEIHNNTVKGSANIRFVSGEMIDNSPKYIQLTGSENIIAEQVIAIVVRINRINFNINDFPLTKRPIACIQTIPIVTIPKVVTKDNINPTSRTAFGIKKQHNAPAIKSEVNESFCAPNKNVILYIINIIPARTTEMGKPVNAI